MLAVPNKACFAKLFPIGLRNPGYHHEKLPHIHDRPYNHFLYPILIEFRDAELKASRSIKYN